MYHYHLSCVRIPEGPMIRSDSHKCESVEDLLHQGTWAQGKQCHDLPQSTAPRSGLPQWFQQTGSVTIPHNKMQLGDINRVHVPPRDPSCFHDGIISRICSFLSFPLHFVQSLAFLRKTPPARARVSGLWQATADNLPGYQFRLVNAKRTESGGCCVSFSNLTNEYIYIYNIYIIYIYVVGNIEFYWLALDVRLPFDSRQSSLTDQSTN